MTRTSALVILGIAPPFFVTVCVGLSSFTQPNVWQLFANSDNNHLTGYGPGYDCIVRCKEGKCETLDVVSEEWGPALPGCEAKLIYEERYVDGELVETNGPFWFPELTSICPYDLHDSDDDGDVDLRDFRTFSNQFTGPGS